MTYFAYLDEFGHIGPYLGRQHRSSSPRLVHGTACLEHWRSGGRALGAVLRRLGIQRDRYPAIGRLLGALDRGDSVAVVEVEHEDDETTSKGPGPRPGRDR